MRISLAALLIASVALANDEPPLYTIPGAQSVSADGKDPSIRTASGAAWTTRTRDGVSIRFEDGRSERWTRTRDGWNVRTMGPAATSETRTITEFRGGHFVRSEQKTERFEKAGDKLVIGPDQRWEMDNGTWRRVPQTPPSESPPASRY
jgi:hypothetical protein